MTSSRRKLREFYMDTDLLDVAINSCDLGDGYMAKVRMFPHKDHIKYYTKVREVSPDLDAAIYKMVVALDAIAFGATWAGNEYGCRLTAKGALTAYEKVIGK